MSKTFPSLEKTLVIIKPDGVKRGLVGKMVSRFEQLGLKLVASRMVLATKEQARGNYPGNDKEWLTHVGEKTIANYSGDLKSVKADIGTDVPIEIGKKIFESMVNFWTSGPIILMVWEGNHAVSVARKIAGATSPDIALPGTIRGDYGFDSAMLASKSGRVVFQNLLHISDSKEEAEREIKHWFGEKYKYLGGYERIDYMGSFEAIY